MVAAGLTRGVHERATHHIKALPKITWKFKPRTRNLDNYFSSSKKNQLKTRNSFQAHQKNNINWTIGRDLLY